MPTSYANGGGRNEMPSDARIYRVTTTVQFGSFSERITVLTVC